LFNKLLTLDDVLGRLTRWREQNKKIVFTNGCFDIIHPGHLTLLKQAAKYGDILIVGLNSDTSVRRLKGEGRPINTEQSRVLMLVGLPAVNAVVIFAEDTPIDLIRQIRPDFLAKGGDYKKEEVIGGSLVESYGGRVILTPLIDGYSTTRIVDQTCVSSPAEKPVNFLDYGACGK
jgi:rfaE bifunctional protein nucleotidyltransferase chain/domain